MLGISIGSVLGGRLADRTTHPLRLYALAEAAIGAYCILFPLAFPWLQDFYLAIAPPIGEGADGPRNAIRFLVGVAAFLLPSVFMGITTPAFARALSAGRPDLGRWLARLYGWNTFGAAMGAFLTAYLLVPVLGLVGGMALVSGLQLLDRDRGLAPLAADAPRADTGARGARPRPRARACSWSRPCSSRCSRAASCPSPSRSSGPTCSPSSSATPSTRSGSCWGRCCSGSPSAACSRERLSETEERARSTPIGVCLALAGVAVLAPSGSGTTSPRLPPARALLAELLPAWR